MKIKNYDDGSVDILDVSAEDIRRLSLAFCWVSDEKNFGEKPKTVERMRKQFNGAYDKSVEFLLKKSQAKKADR